MHQLKQKHSWDKVFKIGPSKICGRQPLKNLKSYGQPKETISLQIFLKAVFHKFYLVHSCHPSDHHKKLILLQWTQVENQNIPAYR